MITLIIAVFMLAYLSVNARSVEKEQIGSICCHKVLYEGQI